VPPRIFRSRTLAGADALTILIGTVAVGVPFVLTFYAQQVLGYSALKFGISSVVLALGATAGAIAGQATVGKAGFRPAAATVAVSRSQHYLAAHKGANPLAALTEGYQSAFLARAVLAGIGLALAFLLPGRPWKPAHELPEPDPAADAAAAAAGEP
jgi:hypothetical protein